MLHNVFIWFLDQANIGLDPQIMILHEVISEILEISDFEAGVHGDPPLAHGLRLRIHWCKTPGNIGSLRLLLLHI